ncbi:MAG TPA: flagellar hook-basal body protein [Nitrospirota bacterium]|nr:flagellar hook-basal body protein [Nitrospirota bacterium]
MYKGMYIAASGAILKQTQLEVITQNLANANTAGYKKDGVTFKDYLMPQDGTGSGPDGRVMSEFSAEKTDFTVGTTVRTGNPLDIAVEGSGFIALEGDQYTRRGDLVKNSEGYLTTHDGVKVMGSGGPISIPSDSVQISIDLEGKVSALQADATLPTEIDTIRVTDFGPDVTLTKVGNSMFKASGPGTAASATIKQGYLENANVDTVKEMVRMIETMREFESYQKAIQIFDNATSKVTNQLGTL